jgi:hypothetical protein
MFDDLKCELLIGAPAGTTFQTKDLGCRLVHYTLTANGRLIHHDADWETTPQAERPYPNDDGLLGLCGMIRRVPGSQRDVDTEFDGDVTFHDGRPIGHHGWRHDFGAVYPTARHSFADLWQTINAKRGYPWESNPWVWVLEFEMAEDRGIPNPDMEYCLGAWEVRAIGGVIQ